MSSHSGRAPLRSLSLTLLAIPTRSLQNAQIETLFRPKRITKSSTRPAALGLSTSNPCDTLSFKLASGGWVAGIGGKRTIRLFGHNVAGDAVAPPVGVRGHRPYLCRLRGDGSVCKHTGAADPQLHPNHDGHRICDRPRHGCSAVRSVLHNWLTGLLVIASGYLFSSLIAIPFALTFPSAFVPTGLLGAGVQSAAWLNVSLRFGFTMAPLDMAS